MRNYIVILSIGMFMFSSCKKEEKISEVPAIEFISISPKSSVEFQNQVVIRICYVDGDGDLGSTDPDVYSVFVKDKRLPAADEYHLQPLTPPDQSLQIQGELDIVLTGLFVIDTANNSESTNFTVEIKDRAGNTSNSIETSNITIRKAS